MINGKFKSFLKCFAFGILWGTIAVIISLVITKINNYYTNEVLFIVGIIMIGIGLISIVGGHPMGLSLNGLGSQAAQYTSDINLETTRKEKELDSNNRKVIIEFGFTSIAIIVGGIIPVIASFII